MSCSANKGSLGAPDACVCKLSEGIACFAYAAGQDQCIHTGFAGEPDSSAVHQQISSCRPVCASWLQQGSCNAVYLCGKLPIPALRNTVLSMFCACHGVPGVLEWCTQHAPEASPCSHPLTKQCISLYMRALFGQPGTTPGFSSNKAER